MDTIDLCSGSSEGGRSPAVEADYDFVRAFIDSELTKECPNVELAETHYRKSPQSRIEDKEQGYISLVSDDEENGVKSLSGSRSPLLDGATSSGVSSLGNSQESGPLNKKRAAGGRGRREVKEKSRERAVKKAVSENQKSLKPGECMKYMVVEVDPDLLSRPEFVRVRDVLEASGASVSPSVPRHCASCLGWTRRQPRYLLTHQGQLTVSPEVCREPHLLVVFTIKELAELMKSRTLHSRVTSLRESSGGSQLTLLLYGAAEYLRNLKNKKNKQWKNNVKGISENEERETESGSTITDNDLDYYLTKLLFEESVCCTRAESPEELAQVVLQFTKAVAESPYKKDKHAQDLQADFYMRGDNRDCVKVDAQGNGLLRLWCQALSKLPLAGPDTARALCQRFPSPTSLLQAVADLTPESAVQLLAEVQVRRDAGPLAAPRRLGPELAKKLLVYFTSADGDQLLS